MEGYSLYCGNLDYLILKPWLKDRNSKLLKEKLLGIRMCYCPYCEGLNDKNILYLSQEKEVECQPFRKKPYTFRSSRINWLISKDLSYIKASQKTIEQNILEIKLPQGGAKPDKDLKQKLLEKHNIETIISWVMDGYKLYKEEGF